MVTGVSDGYVVTLVLVGVGYRSGAAGVVDAYTACDGEQPGSEAPLLFVAMQVGVGADERLLQ